MKKLLTLMLVAALALSMVACGGNNTESEPTPAESQETNAVDKNDKTNYVGTWETEHYRLEITKGGVGRYETTDGTTPYDLNWEVTDEVLVTQISFFGMEHKAVLELNEDASSLSVIQFGFPEYIETEKVFTKQP